MPIKIDFLSDANAVIRETGDIEKGLDAVADALDDVARDATTSGKKVADGLEKGEDSADRLEKSFRELARNGRRQMSDLGDNIGDEVKRGTRRAEDGFDDMKDEARQSVRETAASFKEVGDVGDLVQESLANVFVGFGPAAAVAGFAAAAGFGILTEAIRNDSEASKQRVASMYADMTESGNRYLSDSFKREAIGAILNDEEGALSSLSNAQEIATRTGSDLATVIQGLIGDTAAQAEVEANRKAALEEADAAQAKYIETNGQASAAIGEQIGALDSAGHAFERVNGEQATAAERAQILGAAMSDTAGGLAAAADKAQYLKDKLASFPTNGTYRLDVDDSALEAALTRQQGRTITVNVEGQITRIGNQVW